MHVHLQLFIKTLACHLYKRCFLTCRFIHKVHGSLVIPQEEGCGCRDVEQEYLRYAVFLVNIHHLEVAVEMEGAEIPFLYVRIFLAQFFHFAKHGGMGTGYEEACFVRWLLEFCRYVHKESGTQYVTNMIGGIYYHGSVGVPIEELQSGQCPVGKLLKQLLVVYCRFLWQMASRHIVDGSVCRDEIRLFFYFCINEIFVFHPIGGVEYHREDDVAIHVCHTICVFGLGISLRLTYGIAKYKETVLYFEHVIVPHPQHGASVWAQDVFLGSQLCLVVAVSPFFYIGVAV